jgi:uncharacterized protein (TIGR02271 family)
MYDTRGAADAARDELVGLGIPSANIVVRSTETSGQAVSDDRGFWASLSDLFVPDEDRYTYAEGIRRGGHLLSVNVPEGMDEEALDVLERSEPIDVDERSQSWRESGWQGYQAAPASASGAGPTAVLREDAASYAGEAPIASSMADTGSSSAAAYGSTAAGRSVEGEDKLQVIEEQLRVGKREVGRGSVRVRSYVTERPVEEQVELQQERVTVERRPVDRELAPGEATAAFQERTIEAVERGEEAVVSKTARVVEEIGIRKDVERESETVRDTVKRTDVEVEDDRAGRGLGTSTGSATTTETTTSTDDPIRSR